MATFPPSNNSPPLEKLQNFSPEVVVPVDQGKTRFLGLSQEVFLLGESKQQKQALHGLPMKRLSASHELILHGPLLLVGKKNAVLQDDLLLESLESRFHQVRGCLGISVVDGELIELAAEESAFHGTRLCFREKSLFRLDLHHPHCGLIPGKQNANIQRMFGRPRNQFFRRVSPAESEGRLQEGLRSGVERTQEKDRDAECQFAETRAHGDRVGFSRPFRKARSFRKAFVLVEAMMALSVLTVLGLVLLKLSLNILHPRQWVLQQTVSDAYMTYERSFAERIPFESLVADNSPFPRSPSTSSSQVEVGKLPGGVAIMGTVVRTRIPDPGNYPVDFGTGNIATNPAAMKVWRAQSILTYRVGTRTYAKSRTVVRSQ